MTADVLSAAPVSAGASGPSPRDLAGAADADWTIREIVQQPAMWQAALAQLDAGRGRIDAWLAPILAKNGLRIILTGAGTSAYAGLMLAPALTVALGRPVEAIATTDIVACPADHLLASIPTLLISFARSGGSPESVAAVELADQVVADAHHLVLCCNPDSALVRTARDHLRDAMVLTMPSETLDRSFAMTSSVTSMVLTVLALFAPDADQATRLGRTVDRLIDGPVAPIDAVTGSGLTRAIFLGSGCFAGTAREAALKCLELSAGRSIAVPETALGLRHGPKFMIDRDTVVVMLASDDPHTHRYEQDLLAELARDRQARAVVRLDEAVIGAGDSDSDTAMRGVWRALAYLVWCQLLAYRNALVLGIDPDNPSPGGEVNRVVQGVTIHPYEVPAA